MSREDCMSCDDSKDAHDENGCTRCDCPNTFSEVPP